MTIAAPTVVLLEGVLWQPGVEWRSSVEALAARFSRAHPLDAAQVLAAPSLPTAAAALATWADAADVDLDRELGRYLDEHLSRWLRPDPTVSRTLRTTARRGPIAGVSCLPAAAARAIARHLGVLRPLADLHGSVTTSAALSSLLEQLGAAAVVIARTDARLPLAPAAGDAVQVVACLPDLDLSRPAGG